MDLTVAESVTGALSFNGQRCTALKIFYVHASRTQEFLARFSEAIAALPMNLLDVELFEGRLCIKGDQTCGVPGALGGACTLGIRPEHLQVAEDGPWMAEVRSMEYLGSDSVIACRIGGQELAVQVAGKPGFTPGQTVRLRFRQESLHYFDARSGARLPQR